MRVKSGQPRKQKHKKLLKSTKGYRMTRNRLVKVAHEAFMHAGQYAYAHRQRKQSQFRQLWIKRIGAAARLHGLSYSSLMSKLKAESIALDRKVLADIAVNNPESFKGIVEGVK